MRWQAWQLFEMLNIVVALHCIHGSWHPIRSFTIIFVVVGWISWHSIGIAIVDFICCFGTFYPSRMKYHKRPDSCGCWLLKTPSASFTLLKYWTLHLFHSLNSGFAAVDIAWHVDFLGFVSLLLQAYRFCCDFCDFHDDVIKWKHFPRNWPFVRSPVNFPHKGQWRGALMFSLIYAWINWLVIWDASMVIMTSS